MSAPTIVHLSPSDAVDEGSDSASLSSDSNDEEETFSDWVDDARPCQSLFDAKKELPNAEQAFEWDKKQFGVDIREVSRRLGLEADVYGWIRLVNWIRREKPTPESVLALQDAKGFEGEEYLKPVVEDDPVLQFQGGGENWSDSESEGPTASAEKRVAQLEKKLAVAKQEFADYRSLVGRQLGGDFAALRAAFDEPGPSKKDLKAATDDDSHYFDSYGENDIHAVMLQDKVRTSTYAQFILSNSALFSGATVLDVGCGTGILSLFAARAGAKRVYAVDASKGIVSRAKEIVKVNKLDEIITVVEGKVEDVVLPGLEQGEKVDVIISEWMGYALLYESMLDSVLVARDRFLKPGGVMAPSQCRMMLALCDPVEVRKERVEFWDDVYGFDLSVMQAPVYTDSVVDIIPPTALLSSAACIKDLHLSTLSPSQLNFAAAFTLTSTADKRQKVHAFVLYFDTFFLPSSGALDSAEQVKIIREGDAILADVWPLGAGVGRPVPLRRASTKSSTLSPTVERSVPPEITSFSTGPQSVPTHWKQTLFLLKEPVGVVEGTKISGTFHCTKSDVNSRELDVEIHYHVVPQDAEGGKVETVVQMYKVR
ncbi:Protein arginine N-methyltransferase [Mycena indigotica]|uniref:type I protein arginine methyltransferase n=1 Tax=Mycena indigotica TaxID=2126181 RepID=A0A8H6S5C3_9AGAR|nr:Protein arginine N-methyltransferase [Mycena indigotica]KAF7292107.1 Protein arginine N-methyltransferase [Mycena indigotica]